jgi:hypothetical protein
LLKCTSEDLYNHYDQIEAPLKVGVWTTCAINFNFGPMKSHLDKDDYKTGFCWVIPFGNFTGGELFFKDIIKMRPGMVVAFKSALLYHEVLEVMKEIGTAWFYSLRKIASFLLSKINFSHVNTLAMNTTISTDDHGNWTPADITGMVNLALTFICLLINLHQSYNHKYYKSSCCGDTCFDVIVDTSLSESLVEKPKK